MSEFESKSYFDGKDLLENPDLCHDSKVMERAIENDPKLIRLVKWDCSLSDELIKKTLKKYTVTKEDLLENPDLCRNQKIMKYLPEFRLYSASLSEQEKVVEIVKCLKDERDISVETLPFLDYRFGSRVDINKLSELFNLLNIKIDENNLKHQQKYYDVLDKVIDSVVNIRYLKGKVSYKYPSVVALHDDMVKAFSNTSRTKNLNRLLDLISDLYIFSDVSREDIKKKIVEFYKIYLEQGSIGLGLTSDFCNFILNQHRNKFMSAEKEQIKGDLILKFELAKRRKKSILKGRKLKKIPELIRTKNFQKLGIKEEDYEKLFNDIKKQIVNNSIVKAAEIENIDIAIDNLIALFNCLGYIDENAVISMLKLKDEKVVNYIFKKIENIKIKLLNNGILDEDECYISEDEKLKIGELNFSEYLIANKSKVYENIAKIFLNIDDKILTKILDNKEILNEVIYLIPLVDLMPELDIDVFINILVNYDRVRSKMFDLGALIKKEGKLDLTKIADLINLSNAYSSIDDITLCALGKDVSSEIREDRIKSYLDFYLEMIDKNVCDIPSVSYSDDKYKFDSGLYSAPERLLIGLKTKEVSCIDLFEAGVGTYNEVLCKNSGDVILVRDKNDNLVSRILLFRRGNVIQMVTQVVDRYPVELYREIACQIMEKAVLHDDNIDYIFVNASSYSVLDAANSGYRVVQDNRFVDNFPHADFADFAILLVSKSMVLDKNEGVLKLDFDVKPEFSYLKRRKEVSWCPDESEITRLRALDIVMEKNKIVKESKARNFEYFDMNNYQNIVCGEDWYIALKNDGTIEELILPSKDEKTKDERGFVEFYEARKEMLLMSDNYSKSKGKD